VISTPSTDRYGRCTEADRPEEGVMLMTVLLVVLLVLAIVGGGAGHARWGYAGWSPVGLIVVIFAILWFTGTMDW
jgi:hypothetical protein